MRRRVASWALRGVAIVALAAIVGLWAMARPAIAPTGTTAATDTPSSSPTLTDTARAAADEEVASTPTPKRTATPSATPTQPQSPLPPPTPSVVPTPSVTETIAADASATITVTPTPTPARTQLAGRIELQSYTSQVTGATETYSIYLPPQYDRTDRRFPVLYLLHGWPSAYGNWDTIGADELADGMISGGALPPFLIVMPQATERLYVYTAGGATSFEAQLINDLIPNVDATYRTWAARDGRALGGISRGGVWALEIGFIHADTFATIGAHSPALSKNSAPAAYDPFNLLNRQGVETLRIYLDAGDVDWAYKDTRSLHEAMDAQGLAHIFVVHPGGHANALWSASLGEYLAFYSYGWPMDGVAP